MTWFRWVDRHLEEFICCSALVVIAVCVFAQVVARYIFSTALHWTEEVAAISMVWAVYMGAALCVRERFHIRIMVGVKSLPTAYARIVIFAADFCWAFFCLFMLKVSWDFLAVGWKYTSLSPSLGIDQFYPQTILFIGYGLMLVRLIQLYVHWYREGGHGLPGMLEEEWADTAPDQEHQL